jgi:hypothetical protein
MTKDDYIEVLEELIFHVYLHSNYSHSGYSQMTTSQKQIWDEIIKVKNEDFENKDY